MGTTASTPKAPAMGTTTSTPLDTALPQYTGIKITYKYGSNYGSIVNVVVGQDKTQEVFYVHQDLIKSHSKLFKAALSNDWVENQEKSVKLPDQHPDTFRMYLDCLYCPGPIPFAILSGIQTVGKEITNADRGDAAIHRLSELWILADYLGDVKITNRVMDRLMYQTTYYSDWMISWPTISSAYLNTTPESALCRWIIDLVSLRLSPTQLDGTDAANIPHGLLVLFLKRIAVDQRENNRRLRPAFAQRSNYYV